MIGFGNIYIMPYMHFYLDQLRKTTAEIHLIYWDRDLNSDASLPDDITPIKFEYRMPEGVPRWKKLGALWSYRKRFKQIVQAGNYDFAIVLTTPPGILLLDLLKKYFTNNYIFDFRDITSENNWLYRKIVNKLIKHSILTFVSSDAFRRYLTGANIHTSHNLLIDSLGHRNVRRVETRDIHPIRIRYWGIIRHEEINRSIITKLANDPRFELHYHGREDDTACSLKALTVRLQANNIHFHGLYKPEDRYKFAIETDLLHNLFENDQTMQPAMANKFYDGIIFYLPQLCNQKSFMGLQVSEHGIGLECSPYSSNFVDDIYEYYHSIKWASFESKCDLTLNNILEEYNEGIRLINSHLLRRMSELHGGPEAEGRW